MTRPTDADYAVHAIPLVTCVSWVMVLRGDEGNRTPNPCLAKAVLCQLSYVPSPVRGRSRTGGLAEPLVRQAFLALLAPVAGAVASRHRSSCALADLLRRTTNSTPPATATRARSFFTSIASFGKTTTYRVLQRPAARPQV